jgi:hypothetical protein
LGKGYLVFTVSLFSYLKSMHNLNVPSFFLTKVLMLLKVKHLDICTLSSTILPTAFSIPLIMVYSFCKVFLILGKLLVLNQYINISPSLVEILVFLGIHLQILVVPKNIQVLALFYFLAPPHGMHTTDVLSSNIS